MPERPPGWYQSPSGPEERWWNGKKWTKHVIEPEPVRRGNGFAVVAISCGAFAFILNPFLILSVLAIVFGGLGLSRSNVTGFGKPPSIIGIVLGIASLVLGLVLLQSSLRNF